VENRQKIECRLLTFLDVFGAITFGLMTFDQITNSPNFGKVNGTAYFNVITVSYYCNTANTEKVLQF
jgi:hypothetical protein